MRYISTRGDKTERRFCEILLEGLARRSFSTRVKERMLLAGFFLLMLLMVTVIYNDLTRLPWVEHLMFWR